MRWRNTNHQNGVTRFAFLPRYMYDTHLKLWLGFYDFVIGDDGKKRRTRGKRTIGLTWRPRWHRDDNWQKGFAILPIWTDDGYTIVFGSYMQRFTGPERHKYSTSLDTRREYHHWYTLSLSGYLEYKMSSGDGN